MTFVVVVTLPLERTQDITQVDARACAFKDCEVVGRD